MDIRAFAAICALAYVLQACDPPPSSKGEWPDVYVMVGSRVMTPSLDGEIYWRCVPTQEQLDGLAIDRPA